MKSKCKNELISPFAHGTLSLEGIAELHKFMQKEKELQEVCNLELIKIRPNDGRNYIYINRKQFIGSDRADLINKLYDHFYGTSLEGLYPNWLRWRRDCTCLLYTSPSPRDCS